MKKFEKKNIYMRERERERERERQRQRQRQTDRQTDRQRRRKNRKEKRKDTSCCFLSLYDCAQRRLDLNPGPLLSTSERLSGALHLVTRKIVWDLDFQRWATKRSNPKGLILCRRRPLAWPLLKALYQPVETDWVLPLLSVSIETTQ